MTKLARRRPGYLCLGALCSVFIFGFSGTSADAADTTYSETIPGYGSGRYYIVHTPPSYNPSATKKWPVIFFLHGGAGRATDVSTATVNLSAYADSQDANGFIVVYPQGYITPGTTSGRGNWNAGSCDGANGVASCGSPSNTANTDDVGYLAAVLTEVSANFKVDSGKVYALGHSDGGSMAHRLGCERSDLFTAVGAIEGSIKVANCQPTRLPLSVVSFHSKGDTNNPYYGTGADQSLNVGYPTNWNSGNYNDTSVVYATSLWATLNACTASSNAPTDVSAPYDDYILFKNRCGTYPSGTPGQVWLYSLCDPYSGSCGAPHNWLNDPDYVTGAVNWPALAWSFFKSKSK